MLIVEPLGWEQEAGPGGLSINSDRLEDPSRALTCSMPRPESTTTYRSSVLV